MNRLTWPDLVLPPINLLVLTSARSFYSGESFSTATAAKPKQPRSHRSLSSQVRGFCQNLS